jgi:DNA ligase (NAD+)
VRDFFSDPRHITEIQRLEAAGLQMSIVAEEASGGSDALAGMTVVVSGNFSISRDEMKALIERHGGRNSGSVSGKTSFLLAGEKPGPEKLRKCAELGVKVIGEAEFFSMLPDSSMPAEKAAAAGDGDGELTLFG